MMPSSPMLGRRSGTNSPKMDRLDFVKDSVIGELSSRIGKPIPEFNKNKRGKKKKHVQTCPISMYSHFIIECVVEFFFWKY